MQWENLTSLDFARTVEQCQGVGVIPVGVIEAHGSHLPLGTDMIKVHYIACRAAELEPAIVFPAYPFGTNVETAHLPGAVVVPREQIFALLETICDEMARNGLTKIILISGHGGNRHFLPLFVQTLPEKNKTYVVYFADPPELPRDGGLLESGEYGHACEWETSVLRYIDDSLVRLDQAPPVAFTSMARNKALEVLGVYTQADWYSMYPHMVVGDPRSATAEKGKAFVEHDVLALAAVIRAVKADDVTPALVEEFIQRKQKPTAPAFWTKGT